MLETLALALAIFSQDSVSDRATLVVREGGREIGRETYVLRHSRLPDGQQGYVLDARSRRRNLTASATVQLSAEGLPIEFTFTRQLVGEAPVRIRGTAGRGRFRIIRTSSTGDALREYPMRNGLVLADNALLALYTMLARQVAAGRSSFRALNLSLEECCSLQIEDRGMGTTELRNAPARLRHIIITFPKDVHHLWLTELGQLAKVEIPARNLVAERQRT